MPEVAVSGCATVRSRRAAISFKPQDSSTRGRASGSPKACGAIAPSIVRESSSCSPSGSQPQNLTNVAQASVTSEIQGDISFEFVIAHTGVLVGEPNSQNVGNTERAMTQSGHFDSSSSGCVSRTNLSGATDPTGQESSNKTRMISKLIRDRELIPDPLAVQAVQPWLNSQDCANVLQGSATTSMSEGASAGMFRVVNLVSPSNCVSQDLANMAQCLCTVALVCYVMLASALVATAPRRRFSPQDLVNEAQSRVSAATVGWLVNLAVGQAALPTISGFIPQNVSNMTQRRAKTDLCGAFALGVAIVSRTKNIDRLDAQNVSNRDQAFTNLGAHSGAVACHVAGAGLGKFAEFSLQDLVNAA